MLHRTSPIGCGAWQPAAAWRGIGQHNTRWFRPCWLSSETPSTGPMSQAVWSPLFAQPMCEWILPMYATLLPYIGSARSVPQPFGWRAAAICWLLGSFGEAFVCEAHASLDCNDLAFNSSGLLGSWLIRLSPSPSYRSEGSRSDNCLSTRCARMTQNGVRADDAHLVHRAFQCG